jgi:hypothetical protein
MTKKFKEAIQRSIDKKLGICVMQLEDALELETKLLELTQKLEDKESEIRMMIQLQCIEDDEAQVAENKSTGPSIIFENCDCPAGMNCDCGLMDRKHPR